jgi:FKBP-type peptidyl-prolyl cis-trans isomerase SlpA
MSGETVMSTSGGDDEAGTIEHQASAGEPARVAAGAHLTLHYRVSLADSGQDVMSTFAGKPATLQLGIGQMAESLERCLLGLVEGSSQSFELEPAQAFGERNPALLQRLARRVFDAHVSGDSAYVPGDLVELPAPDGSRYAGVIKAINNEFVLFDFNHPLAGQRIRLDVQILGVL